MVIVSIAALLAVEEALLDLELALENALLDCELALEFGLLLLDMLVLDFELELELERRELLLDFKLECRELLDFALALELVLAVLLFAKASVRMLNAIESPESLPAVSKAAIA